MTELREGYRDWKSWTPDQFGRIDRRTARYYRWHTRRAVGERTGLRVLEVGFGNGAFLGFCRQQGWHVTAIEIDHELRERATAAGFPAFGCVQDVGDDQTFDLIALFDVLEHLPAEQCVQFVRSLRQRLAPEGAIMIRVPNGDSPFGRRHQHGDLTHVCSFGEFKLRQVAQLCDLKLVALGESAWHSQQHDSRTVRTWLRAVLRSVFNRVLGYAYFGATVDLTPNLFAVLVERRSPRPALS